MSRRLKLSASLIAMGVGSVMLSACSGMMSALPTPTPTTVSSNEASERAVAATDGQEMGSTYDNRNSRPRAVAVTDGDKPGSTYTDQSGPNPFGS